MRKGNEYEFYIEKLKFPSIGVAEKDGKTVLIKNTLPGQKIKARISRKKKDYLEAKVTEIIENVKYAKEVACPHFSLCGGCISQFIPYDKQIELKEQQVLELFHSAGIRDFKFLGIEKSPEEFQYRNKMEFSFGDEERDGKLTLGMHMKDKGFSITSYNYGTFVDEDFTMVLDKVVKYFRKIKLPYYRVRSHNGYLRNLVLRKGKNTGELLINIVTTSQIEFDFDEITEVLKNLEYKGKLSGIVHTINDSLSDVVQIDKLEILYGMDYIMEEILGLKFKISPKTFFQTNSKGAEKLYGIVKEFLGDVSSKIVFDLYCGTGTIAQIVASNAKKVIGVELVEEAVESANENACLNKIENCEFIAGDVAKVVKALKDKPDLIILDPPRPGIHPKALKQIIDFNVNEIVYVSCNPKTLVEDLKILIEGGYKIDKVKLMDMFPHTAHVECVVLMSRIEK